MGPVDSYRSPALGVAPAAQTYTDRSPVPLLRRRVQVVAEGLDGGTYSIDVLPFRASAYVPYAAGVADGVQTWIHCGGSAGGVFIEGVRVTIAGGGAEDPVIVLTSIPEGL